jgi:hypothetical protein
MTPAEFTRRTDAFQRGQRIVAVIATLPLLGVYLLVHTPWLKAGMQDHRHLVVALLIGVPLAWLLAWVQGWRRFGPRWVGLGCAACAEARDAASRAGAAAPARCAACGATLVDDGDGKD